MNSKRVLRFSGDGAVTKMLLYPNPKAPAMANPSAADCTAQRQACIVADGWLGYMKIMQLGGGGG